MLQNETLIVVSGLYEDQSTMRVVRAVLKVNRKYLFIMTLKLFCPLNVVLLSNNLECCKENYTGCPKKVSHV